MARRMLALLLSLWLLLPFLHALAEETPGEEAVEGRVTRALLVGCDRFISQPETTPSSANNVVRMAQALSSGTEDLQGITTVPDGVSTTGKLAALILDAFSDADADDVSIFYISTHGIWESGMASGGMTLLLSDGERESGVTAYQLRTMFDQIQGTKVLLIDACHSGAMLGKGVPEQLENVFAREDFIVVCSSSGTEKSWYWSGDINGERLAGAGYFSGALIRALSPEGGFGADDNRDGSITLTELKRYLRLTHGASTVQTYPESSDFSIMTYDPQAQTLSRRQALIENVTFENSVISVQEPTVYFSFNVVSSVQVAYQLVYHRQGRWDFDNAQIIYDNNGQYGSWPVAGRTLPMGLKERALTLIREDTANSGYVLLQILTIEKGLPEVVSSQIICVPPESGDPRLGVITPAFFCPEDGEELTFNILHDFPCEMTVTIEDMEGNTIRRIWSREPTRPELLDPVAVSCTWDGLTNQGEAAAEGLYRIRVKAWVGGERYEYLSEPIQLQSLWG